MRRHGTHASAPSAPAHGNDGPTPPPHATHARRTRPRSTGARRAPPHATRASTTTAHGAAPPAAPGPRPCATARQTDNEQETSQQGANNAHQETRHTHRSLKAGCPAIAATGANKQRHRVRLSEGSGEHRRARSSESAAASRQRTIQPECKTPNQVSHEAIGPCMRRVSAATGTNHDTQTMRGHPTMSARASGRRTGGSRQRIGH